MADALEPMDKARQAWLSQEKETMHAADRYQPLLLAKRAFAAGFAAGLAHAPTAPDPATVAAMRNALKLIADRDLIDPARPEWRSIINNLIRALLGPAATEEKTE